MLRPLVWLHKRQLCVAYSVSLKEQPMMNRTVRFEAMIDSSHYPHPVVPSQLLDAQQRCAGSHADDSSSAMRP